MGPGQKILGGWDFIGENSSMFTHLDQFLSLAILRTKHLAAWPNGPLYPTDQPWDQLGEGTHQAGILAAEGPLWVTPPCQFHNVKSMLKSTTDLPAWRQKHR